MTRLPSDPRGPGSAADIARRIRRMTQLLRHATLQAQDLPRAAAQKADAPAAPASAGLKPGWWVLAQGRALDPEDFAAREAVREELLEAVRQSGVLVDENVWVWDESCRAQLVLATLPTKERARRLAEHLRRKGLVVAVRPAMP